MKCEISWASRPSRKLIQQTKKYYMFEEITYESLFSILKVLVIIISLSAYLLCTHNLQNICICKHYYLYALLHIHKCHTEAVGRCYLNQALTVSYLVLADTVLVEDNCCFSIVAKYSKRHRVFYLPSNCAHQSIKRKQKWS